MLNLAVRNFKIYIRDKNGVFFSFLGIVIIIGLYILFLGKSMTDDLTHVKDAGLLVDSWVMAGIVAVASITTSMGALSIMVEDKARKTAKDFLSAPIKRYQLVSGYIASTFLSGFVMSLLTLILAEIYLAVRGYPLLTPLALIKIFGIIVLSVLASSSIVLFIVSFLRTTGSFANASIILGTLIGFVTGMYIPIGVLSDKTGWLVKGFPISHASALLRQVMMEDAVKVSFDGASAEVLAEFQEYMGITFTFGDKVCTTGTHILILLGTAAVFFLAALLNLSRKQK